MPPRARIILESGESRPFEPFDRWGHEAFTPVRSTAELLREFTVLRQANLEALDSLRLDEKKLDSTGVRNKERGTRLFGTFSRPIVWAEIAWKFSPPRVMRC